MKVLQLNSHYNQGGAARIAAYIHRQLLADGVESYVAYGRGAISQEKNVWRFDRTWEIYLSALLSRLTGINGWFNRRATKRLIKRMEEIQPDVIHMHALHGYYLNFPMLFQYINEKKIPACGPSMIVMRLWEIADISLIATNGSRDAENVLMCMVIPRASSLTLQRGCGNARENFYNRG